MPSSVPLTESGTVVLDGSGNGTVRIGPLTAREVWHPAYVHVSANQSPTNEAECQIFVGDTPTPDHYVDGTFSGSSGDSSDSIGSREVPCGTKIIAVWTGGDPGVTATLAVTGTKVV